MGDILPMSQRELSRLEVIQRVCRKTLTQARAADLLSLSVRQVKRLCRAYRGEGAASLASKRRGRPSNHRLPEEVVTKARELLRGRYHDFGPTLAREKLVECHGLSLGVESVFYAEQERAQARVVEPKSIDVALSRPAAGAKREREGVALSHPWRDFNYSEKSVAAREQRGELCRLRK